MRIRPRTLSSFFDGRQGIGGDHDNGDSGLAGAGRDDLVWRLVAGEDQTAGRGLQRGELNVRPIPAGDHRLVGEALEIAQRRVGVHGAYAEALHKLVQRLLAADHLPVQHLDQLSDGDGVEQSIQRGHPQHLDALGDEEGDDDLLHLGHGLRGPGSG